MVLFVRAMAVPSIISFSPAPSRRPLTVSVTLVMFSPASTGLATELENRSMAALTPWVNTNGVALVPTGVALVPTGVALVPTGVALRVGASSTGVTVNVKVAA